jgi:hypothetical protein
LAVDPEAYSKWEGALWAAYKCPPVGEPDRVYAWMEMGDRCARYLKLHEAVDYYLRARPGLKLIEDNMIPKLLEAANVSRAKKYLSPLTRETLLAQQPGGPVAVLDRKLKRLQGMLVK